MSESDDDGDIGRKSEVVCSERGRVGDRPSAGIVHPLCTFTLVSHTTHGKTNTQQHITSPREFQQVSHIPLQLITCYLKQCLAGTDMSGEISRAEQPDLWVLEQQSGEEQRSG